MKILWPLRDYGVRVSCSVVLMLLLAACQQGKPTESGAGNQQPPAVTVAQPMKQEVVEWDEYTARIEAVEDVEVRARVSGYLEKVAFTDGTVVEKGDLLFVIDRRPFEAELRQSEA